MTEQQKDDLIKLQSERLRAVHELVERLFIDDVDNSVRNAKRCLENHGYHELNVMVHNYFYNAGQNQMINEIREALGQKRLWMPGEKEAHDLQVKMAQAGTKHYYDSPPLNDFEQQAIDGSARLVTLGEEGDMIVIGTKSRSKALRLMRRYQRDMHGLSDDELVSDDELTEGKVAWRKAYADEGDFEHMFTWNDTNTKNNPHAVDAFLALF